MPLDDSGEAEGLRYYIMPFVTGESLKDRLMRDGALPFNQAIRLGLEIAEALGYAHRAGVVHRDVKPANIMIEGDHFILADFGIAAVAPTFSHLTAHGSFIGPWSTWRRSKCWAGRSTAGPTSSPWPRSFTKRWRSGSRLPRRTQPSWPDRSSSAPMRPSTKRPPTCRLACRQSSTGHWPPISTRGSAAEFEASLRRFLGPVPRPTDPPRRIRRGPWLGPVIGAVATGGTLVLWWFATPAAVDPRRVVVAGFTNETGHPALDAFGDQIETWISDSLSHLGRIKVITAAVGLPIRRLWGSTGPATQQERLAALARETRAGTVVTGSFFQTGNRIEISVEVTDARTGQLRWALGPITKSLEDRDQLAVIVGGQVVRAVDSLVARLGPASRTD